MEEIILISRKKLAKRWDLENPNSLINYENSGIITRNNILPTPRYYMEEILEIELLKDTSPFSPRERKKKDLELAKYKQENEMLKDILSKVLGDLSPILNLKNTLNKSGNLIMQIK